MVNEDPDDTSDPLLSVNNGKYYGPNKVDIGVCGGSCRHTEKQHGLYSQVRYCPRKRELCFILAQSLTRLFLALWKLSDCMFTIRLQRSNRVQEVRRRMFYT